MESLVDNRQKGLLVCICTPLLRPHYTVIDGSSTLNISLSLSLFAARMSVSRPAASRQPENILIGGHTVAVW
jgi:hypothetical protein